MSSCVIIGAQWGDEGKGKVVDLFTEGADWVVRFQGGNNAGHTLVVREGDVSRTTVLHLIPSGILHPGKRCLIASGVVVDVDVLLGEMSALQERGVGMTPERLMLCQDAHVILPIHKALDLAREERRGESKIGTTGRGIGPCYEDRAARRGVRLRDLVDEDALRARLEQVLPERNAVLAWLGADEMPLEPMVEKYLRLGEQIQPFLTDSRATLAAARARGDHLLFEGAQGVLLDVGHGTYPFVTSSHTISGGACTGAGVPPSSLDRVVGITKAYATRVGGGPFPTELHDDMGQYLRDRGHEYGSTTGRPRRCGWLDLPALRYAHLLNGFDALAITKLDVLTGLDEVKVCVAWEIDGVRYDVGVADCAQQLRATPIYETLPGWELPIEDVQRLDELPRAARALLDFVEEGSGVPVDLVSVGPRRDQTVVLREPFGG